MLDETNETTPEEETTEETHTEEMPLISTTPPAPAPTTSTAPPVPPKSEPASEKRVFVYDGREFPDPDPKMSVEEVRQYYATFMPELSNATTSESTRTVNEVKEKVVNFVKRVGTKGNHIDEAEFSKITVGSGKATLVK